MSNDDSKKGELISNSTLSGQLPGNVQQSESNNIPINNSDIKCPQNYTGYNFGSVAAPIRMCLAAANNVCQEKITIRGKDQSFDKSCNMVCPAAILSNTSGSGSASANWFGGGSASANLFSGASASASIKSNMTVGPRPFTLPGGSNTSTTNTVYESQNVGFAFGMIGGGGSANVNQPKNSTISNQMPDLTGMICSTNPLN
jgi:hypothetical protein